MRLQAGSVDFFVFIIYHKASYVGVHAPTLEKIGVHFASETSKYASSRFLSRYPYLPIELFPQRLGGLGYPPYKPLLNKKNRADARSEFYADVKTQSDLIDFRMFHLDIPHSPLRPWI